MVLAPPFRSKPIGRGKARAGEKPRSETGAALKFCGLFQQIDKDALRHVLRGVSITANTRKRETIDQVDVPPDQLGEGILRMVPYELTQ